MDRAGRWKQNSPNGCPAEFRLDTERSSTLFHPADTFFPALGVRRSLRRLPLGGSQPRPPPVVSGVKFLPQLPGSPGALGEQIFARETHRHRETLRAFSDQHDMA